MGENAINRFRADTLVPEEITVIDKTTGVGRDISGATFLMTISTQRAPAVENNLFQMVGVITDAANGVVEFTLTDDNADNLGNFFFDVQMKTGGKRSTVMKDDFVMSQDITKDL